MHFTRCIYDIHEIFMKYSANPSKRVLLTVISMCVCGSFLGHTRQSKTRKDNTRRCFASAREGEQAYPWFSEILCKTLYHPHWKFIFVEFFRVEYSAYGKKNINKKFSLLCMKPSTFQSTLLLTTNVNRPVESVISKTVHYMPWNMHAVLLCFSWIPASHTQLVISFSDFVCSWSKHAMKWLVSTNTSS